MDAGAWAIVVAGVVAVGFGGYRLLTDGRLRGNRPVAEVAEGTEEPGGPWAHVSAAVPDARLGEKATLLQFSSAFCAPCRATRRTLAEVAGVVPGVTHLEVDAEHHLDLVRRLGVVRTPTTLVLDARGQEVARASGAPRKEQVLDALAVLPT